MQTSTTTNKAGKLGRSLRMAGVATLLGLAAFAPAASAGISRSGPDIGPADDGEALAWICASWSNSCAEVAGTCDDWDLSEHSGLSCHD